MSGRGVGMKLEFSKVIDILVDFGYLKNTAGPIAPTKPTRGSCCTCQDCGYYHDNCVCTHNELWKALEAARDGESSS